jgi:hypothetical protein
MRFKRESFNDGDEVFSDNFSDELDEIEDVLSEALYQVKHTTEAGKEDQLIFDPVGTNAILQNELKDRNWELGVNLDTDDYSGGKDIDIYKNNVAGEIQFSHYTSLDSDMNRLERLYEGKLQLEGNRDVEAGVVIVVAQQMPTSNSVSHYDQALTRAAPQSLFVTPTLVYGIEPPEPGEEVIHNSYEKPRSRTIIDSRRINFKQTYPLNQTDFDAYTQN